MKRLLLILTATLYISTSLYAQVNSEVEVTKAYIPTVDKATKPQLKATIADTTYINPDVDYTITPLSINTPLQSKPISPAEVTYWEFNKPPMAQLKVGAGYPLNTLLRGYLSGYNADIGYMSANVAHYGNYSNLRSMSGSMVNATEILNSASIDGGLYIGDYTISSKIEYINDSYRRYAFEQSDSPKINYQDVDLALNFGDSFVDLTHFNFNLGAQYSYFVDRESVDNNTLYLKGDFGRNISLGDLRFGADYRYINGGALYLNHTTSLYTSIFDSFNGWQLEMALRYYYDNTTMSEVSSSHHYFIPRVKIMRSVKSALTPFIEVDGSLTQNSFEQVASFNPYVASGQAGKSSVEYDLAAGVERNNSNGTFNFKLYLGYNIELNNCYYLLNVIESTDQLVENSYFEIDLCNLNRSSLNTEINYRPTTNFLLSFAGHLYSYKARDISYTYSPSTIESSLGVEYSPRNLRIGATANYQSKRSYSMRYAYSDGFISDEPTIVLPSTVNLSAYLDWQVGERLSIFVEGDNLLSQNVYLWPLYRGYGARFTAGVKINFR